MSLQREPFLTMFYTHSQLNYQQLSYARYQVSFYTNNYFEYLPIVSGAFNYNN